MFAIEIVKGKNYPKEVTASPTNKKGNTIGLLLHVCSSIHNSGRVVILDIGFYVLQGLVKLRRIGVNYASSVIKKEKMLAKVYSRDSNGLNVGI